MDQYDVSGSRDDKSKSNGNGNKKLGFDIISIVTVAICISFLSCVFMTFINTNYDVPIIVTIAMSGLVGWLFKSIFPRKGL